MEIIKDTLALDKLKELARLREAIVDYFSGENQFKFNEASLKKYFKNH